MTLTDFFERACRRERGTPFGMPGEPHLDPDGNSALFWLSLGKDRRIATVQYRCTTCFTLVALCEHLAELVRGVSPEAAAGWTPERLLSLHPEIPVYRRDRAKLAVAAMQSAAARQSKGVCI